MKHAILLWMVSVAGCASSGGYDLTKTQNELTAQLQTTENLAQKAQGDFAQKKSLLENLNKAGGAEFKSHEAELQLHFKAMESAIGGIAAERKRMIDASGDVASLSYNRAKIEPDDAGYPAAQDALARFSTAMKNVNAKLLDYSRESNTLADKITERKLYYNFDLVAWQKRVQKSLRLAQENQEGMNKEITRAENALKNWNKPELRARQDDVFAEMQGVAQTHSERASRLGPLSKEMSDVTLSNPKITSLNKEWPEVQKLQLEFEQLQAELMQLNERFERKSEAFRNPFKRAQ